MLSDKTSADHLVAMPTDRLKSWLRGDREKQSGQSWGPFRIERLLENSVFVRIKALVSNGKHFSLSKIAFLLLLTQTLLCVISALRMAPVHEEFGRVFAGLSFWKHNDLEVFRVGSPCINALGSLPAWALGLSPDPLQQSRLDRMEFTEGRRLFMKDYKIFYRAVICGRLVVSFFTLLTTVLLVARASLHSRLAALLAGSLWVFQPQVVSHGALIGTDIACSCLILVSLLSLESCVQHGTLKSAVSLGFFAGSAILAKFTAVILIPLVVFFIAWYGSATGLRKQISLITSFILLCLLTIGMPYKYSGCGILLSEFTFSSSLASSIQSDLGGLSNYITLPLPKQMVLGMDQQQLDFERGLPSYAAGRRGIHGWWWFYLYSMLVKMPVGTLVAVGATMLLLFSDWKRFGRRLVIPIVAIGTLVFATSAQSGFAQGHRYILPVYPLLFLVVGVVGARAVSEKSRIIGLPKWLFGYSIVLGVVFSAISCMAVSPNWLSSFNWFGGGNKSGFRCLGIDASDWGQDTFLLRDWLNARKDSEHVYVRSSYSGREELIAVGAREFTWFTSVSECHRPCWVVISKSDMVGSVELDAAFRELPVAEHLGGTHLIYYLRE